MGKTISLILGLVAIGGMALAFGYGFYFLAWLLHARWRRLRALTRNSRHPFSH